MAEDPDSEDFVRGKPKSTSKALVKDPPADILFDETIPKTRKGKKVKEDHELSKPIDELTYKTLLPGTVVMGVVAEVGVTDVVLNLPNGLTGFINGTDVSEEYNQLLQQDDESVAPDLVDMFEKGMYVVCSVVDVTTVNKKKKVMLTCQPEIINKHVTISSLTKNMVLQGVVHSEEDHGYLINLGIEGVTGAFLNKSLVSEDLKLAQIVRITVAKVKENNLVVDLWKKEPKPGLDKKLTSFSSVQPGQLVTAVVKKQSVNGITCSFLGGIRGLVHMIHLTDVLDSTSIQAKYPLKRKLTARVVFVNPDTKKVYLSCLPIHVTMETPTFSCYKGDKLESVTVKKVTRKGVFVDLKNGDYGFVHVTKLQDKVQDKIGANYKTGTSHTCRVMGFRLLDNMVQVSLRASDLQKPFLGYSDIRPCENILVTVVSIHDFGVIVKISDNIRGIVGINHLADVRIKNPSLKFKPNQKVKAKVLSVDSKKRKVYLTLKKSIVQNSSANVLSIEELKINQKITGWVAAIKDYGIIMNFTNNIKGLIHKSDISRDPINLKELNDLYKVGQVLTCKIADVNETELKLSINLLSDTSEQNNGWCRKGNVYLCTVKSSTPKGLTVTMETTEEAFLPVGHLSDHMTLNPQLLLKYKPGMVINEVLVIMKKMNVVTVSAKRSLIDWIQENGASKSVANLKEGDYLPGFVKDIQPYGSFIETAGGLLGLCPKACLHDDFVTSPEEVFIINESVVCKITNTDKEKGRFLASTKMSDMERESSMSSGPLLDSYFSSLSAFSGQTPAKYRQGDVIDYVTVTRVSRDCITCRVDTETTAIIPTSCLDTPPSVGNILAGAVLDYDPLRNSYTLNSKSEFVSKVKTSKRRKLIEGEEHEGTVVLSDSDYFVLMLDNFRFGYLHKRQHLNDSKCKATTNVKVGEKIKVSVFRAKKGKPVLLTQLQPKSKKENRKRKRADSESINFDDIKIGNMYDITVKSVKVLQLNVQLGRKIRGRVHITEVTDDIEEGANPLQAFKQGDKLSAKLIGFRHSKTFRYLPITRTDFIMSVAEFSLRSSVISRSEIRTYAEDEKVYEMRDYIDNLDKGSDMMGFVRNIDSNGFIWICLTSGIEGRLWYTLTSTNKADIDKWKERFTIGQALSCKVFSSRDERLDLSLVGVLEQGTKVWGIVRSLLPGIGVRVQISARDYGIVPLTEISDSFNKDPLSKMKENDMVYCYVVSINNNRITLSTRKSRTSQRFKKQGKKTVSNPVIDSEDDLVTDKIYMGYIKSVSPSAGLYVTLGHNVFGRVLLKNMSDNFLKNWEPMFPVGKLVRTCVIEKDPRVQLSLKKSDLDAIKKIDNDNADTADVQKCLDEILLNRYKDMPSDDEDDSDNMEKEDNASDSDDMDDSAPRIVFSNHGNRTDNTAANKELETALKSSVTGVTEDSEEAEIYDTEDKENNDDGNKGKSFEKRERKRRKLEEEKETRKVELMLRDSAANPLTEDDHERLVVMNPDSSSAWVAYMAYCLTNGRVDKARQVAAKAVTTINYRLESEKLNVWSALFNLENSFGTYDSLMSVCREASSVNDSKAIFTRLATVFESSAKYSELDDIYKTVLLKKHKQSRKVWCSYGNALGAQGRFDEMRELLTRALKSLTKHKHIRTICHFAQLEYKYGEANCGSTMFENILTSYPTRLDIWSVYLDKTIALRDIPQTRRLFERAVGLKLPMKKMKFFYKRYIDFEKSLGVGGKVEYVQNKAQHYIQQERSED